LNAKGSDKAKSKMEDEALDLVIKVPISDAPDCAVKTYGFLDFLRA